VVKSSSLTGEVPWILETSRRVGASGTAGGAVKCVDIGWNSDGEGKVLDPL
jgi:hypothetical protein